MSAVAPRLSAGLYRLFRQRSCIERPYLGQVNGSSGTATVDGTGSLWTVAGTSTGLLVGGSGSGVLNITNGGTVSDDTGYGTTHSPGGTGDGGWRGLTMVQHKLPVGQ